MNESFDKHFTSNADYWHTLARKGFVNTDDIVKARNYYDKYSYAEQNEAVKRLNDALSKVLKRNPDNQGLKQFIASMTEASDEMIKDKVTSSFRDLDNVTDTDITLKAKKLGIPVEEFRNQFKLVKERIDTEKGRERRKKELDEMAWYNPQKWATSDYEKQRYIIDISHLDILKATRTAILTSTFCFINHFGKKLCWLVKDEEIKRAISVLKLQNVEQIVYTKSPDKKAATV